MSPINTPAWARDQLQAFTADDQRVITDLVTDKSLYDIRVPYAKACMERHWPGWQARLVWTIIELLVREIHPEDDIPF